MVLREEFRVQPKSQRVAAGDTALLECGPPRGHPEPTLVWKKNGHPIDFENSKRLRLVDGTNLAIQDSRKTDDGRYQCVVKNVAGTRESTDAVLRVLVKPYIIRGPKDTTVSAGSIIVFECSVGGDAVLTVHWKRLGSAMPEDRMSVLPSRSLQLSDVRLEDGGEYVCEAENAVGKISASATLTVQMAPIVRERPSDLRLEVGRDAVFLCGIEGSPPPSTFWMVEGNRSLIYPGDRVDNIQAEITSDGMNLLKIQNVSRTAAPLIILCLGVNAAGSDLARASLTVSGPDPNPPPVILFGPANQTLPLRSEARLRCQVRGEGSVQWWRGEREVGSGPRVNVTGDGSLVLTDVTKEDSGEYTCVVKSSHGSASWSASLRFESPTNPNIGFFRAPEPSTYPGPPTKPTLVNQTANGLTLAWSRNNQIGSSSLLGYQVEMYSRPLPSSSPSGDTATATWVRVATNVPSPILTLTNLTTGLTYTFLVRALNSHGLSAPSPLSDEIVLRGTFSEGIFSEGGKGIFSENFPDEGRGESLRRARQHLQEGGGSLIELTEILNTDYIEGVYIYSRGLDPPASVAMLTVLHAGEASGFLVTGLAHYSRYEFFLVPFFGSVDGKPSNLRAVRTLECEPSGVPQLTDPVLLNATSVLLKWKPPPVGTHNGVIRTYQIIVGGGNNSALINMTVSASTPTLLLTNLSAGIRYSVSLAATNRAGTGPYSRPALLSLTSGPEPRLEDWAAQGGRSRGDGTMETDLTDLTGGAWLSAPWFIALLTSMVAVMALLFLAMFLFIALLTSMVAVMALLFLAMFFVRRRTLHAKKSSLDHNSAGPGLLATPISLKAASGLPHPGGGLTTANEGLWIDGKAGVGLSHPGGGLTPANQWMDGGSTRATGWRTGEGQVLLPHAQPDYAEVAASGALSTFIPEAQSPAAYATTTLVSPHISRSNAGGSIRRWGTKGEEPLYAPSYYCARNVYSDTYYFGDLEEGSHSGGHANGPVMLQQSSVVLSANGRKAMSELGHKDAHQLSLPPSPPSHAPPSLRRSYRSSSQSTPFPHHLPPQHHAHKPPTSHHQSSKSLHSARLAESRAGVHDRAPGGSVSNAPSYHENFPSTGESGGPRGESVSNAPSYHAYPSANEIAGPRGERFPSRPGDRPPRLKVSPPERSPCGYSSQATDSTSVHSSPPPPAYSRLNGGCVNTGGYGSQNVGVNGYEANEYQETGVTGTPSVNRISNGDLNGCTSNGSRNNDLVHNGIRISNGDLNSCTSTTAGSNYNANNGGNSNHNGVKSSSVEGYVRGRKGSIGAASNGSNQWRSAYYQEGESEAESL
ncbi:hypothetical protein M8J75_008330 [Diaphorina citri]|nr:hypothetical protein M8J75_008330 [Diaphorina citri]